MLFLKRHQTLFNLCFTTMSAALAADKLTHEEEEFLKDLKDKQGDAAVAVFEKYLDVEEFSEQFARANRILDPIWSEKTKTGFGLNLFLVVFQLGNFNLFTRMFDKLEKVFLFLDAEIYDKLEFVESKNKTTLHSLLDQQFLKTPTEDSERFFTDRRWENQFKKALAKDPVFYNVLRLILRDDIFLKKLLQKAQNKPRLVIIDLTKTSEDEASAELSETDDNNESDSEEDSSTQDDEPSSEDDPSSDEDLFGDASGGGVSSSEEDDENLKEKHAEEKAKLIADEYQKVKNASKKITAALKKNDLEKAEEGLLGIKEALRNIKALNPDDPNIGETETAKKKFGDIIFKKAAKAGKKKAAEAKAAAEKKAAEEKAAADAEAAADAKAAEEAKTAADAKAAADAEAAEARKALLPALPVRLVSFSEYLLQTPKKENVEIPESKIEHGERVVDDNLFVYSNKEPPRISDVRTIYAPATFVDDDLVRLINSELAARPARVIFSERDIEPDRLRGAESFAKVPLISIPS